MPQLGETVTEGTITRWLKRVGDHVDADEPLFEVSTDKVDSEVPAPTAGTVTEILVQEGETAEVGARLAVISDGAAPAAEAGAPAAETAAPKPEAAPTPASVPEAPPSPPPAPEAPSEPAAAPPAAPSPEPTPPAPPAREPARPSEPPPPPPAPEPTHAGGQLMSPVVRRLINEYGLNPDEIAGTGEGGRITRNDVLTAASGQPVPAPPRPEPSRPTPTPPPAAPVIPSVEPAAPAAAEPARREQLVGDETIPFDNIRRRTAEHMVRSKETSAHVYTSIEVDYERVDRARRRIREEWKARERFPLTYLQ